MYEVRNIAFSYRRRKVLRDVSFVVSPGETVGVVGDNGAGKTTLLKVLATICAPESGSVLMDGQDAFSHPLRYRRQLGYMPEIPALYDDMTVKGYLTYRANLKGEVGKRIRRRVGEAAEMCLVTDLLARSIRTLSIGQRKRVALADATLLRPRVLLLDDFLAGLDSAMRAASGEILSNVAAFSSVIVTGHEIADLAKWASRFLVLRDGVISSTLPAAGVAAEDLARRVEAALRGGAQ
jgi:ABC-2 type transport system ATP-binding protein